MAAFFPAAVRALADAVYPPACCVCGERIDTGRNGSGVLKASGGRPFLATETPFVRVMAPVMCDACMRDFTPIVPPMCPVCGNMFVSREAQDHVCGACLDFPKRFVRARAAGAYETSLMAAVHKLKYGGKTGLSGPLGLLLLSAFVKWFDPAQVDLVVPVPLHKQKFRQRGFNQAYLLVRKWHRQARALGLTFAREKIARSLLVRSARTRSQTELSRKERIENVKGAFSLTSPEVVAGKRVLLVDDVFTTGATASECAKTLLAGGAARVDVLTLARVNRR